MRDFFYILIIFYRQQSYPEVKFLTYKDRKRVLVCLNIYFLILFSPFFA